MAQDIELDQDALLAAETAIANVSDDEIREAMREKFAALEDLTAAIVAGPLEDDGSSMHMIVIGPPGVGKSYGVEKVLRMNGLLDSMADRMTKYDIVRGAVSGIGMFIKLQQNAARGFVTVFDDCDFHSDEEAMNVIKAATESSNHRIVSWNKDSRALVNAGLENSFEFQGSIIIITNVSSAMVRSKKLKTHLAAIESRCQMLDMGMNSMREKFIRIRQVIDEHGMLDKFKFGKEGNDEILSFMVQNAFKLREISLRSTMKIADLRRAFPRSWKTMARNAAMHK